jgi:putative hydrolase of the HAD superfamily
MTVRAVTFDAAGTLFTVREPVGATYAHAARRCGLDLDPARLEAGFRAAVTAAPPLAFPGVHGSALATSERAWWRDIVAGAFRAAGAAALPADAFETLFAHYGTAAAWRWYEESPGVLAALRVRGLRLGVVSNFDSRLLAVADGLGLAALVDAITISAHVTAAKPSPAVFRAALTALGVAAAETLHVGDSPTADAAGARAAGLGAALVARPPGHPGAVPRDVPVVTSLTQLEELLG